ncbi:PQQ-binding-like beta-propeller repeat protein [Pseudohongiella spirulinae]|uniref:Putative PQQ enzyme repeat protein n=1 Tax=Pseudohongiella spirulinae TaxID=1249552 RepID=A0A0S2KAH0_9GAMM|nr:PQQ-binding-like beta-propeller repeat protein [Pseudohongiella spirulinae]ALO45357.1 Putative PQQ enzyme repeat protein [Pseudohongiella spirulinae]
MKINNTRMAGGLLSVAVSAAMAVPALVSAQESIEWLTLGSDYAHTRFIPASQINADNFESLQTAWVWDGASFQASSGRSTPSYIDGILYTVAGDRRHVVAIDPETGETIWSYREPHTFRHEYSMRKDYGKGVAYGEVNGRGVIYNISPGFFLTALDAKTGAPLEGFGHEIGVEGFPETGVVDLQKVIADYMGYEFDPYYGIPLEEGYITSSSPAIVVNDTVVVGNSAEQGYNQTRIENIPGDILGFDIATGEFKWKFNIIPDKGEFGWDTWQDGDGNQIDDPRAYTGENSSWAPMAADPDLNMVYVNTNSASIDFYRGHTQGDNLYGSSVIALDASTGERKWHFQLVHKDVWNYDTPTAPVLLDVQQNGRTVPILAQVSKQSFTYVFNRETGEPIWPIEERPVPQSKIPGEVLAATQPFPTKPAPYDMQGLTHDDLIDFTPELRQQAIEAISSFEIGPLFHPPLHRDNDLGYQGSLWCPGDIGGVNIDGPAAADPTTGTLFVTSRKGCTNRIIAPAQERDAMLELPTGTTFARYAPLRAALVRGPQGLPLFKPPFSRITAIDLNTGDHKWWIPVGETPDRVKNHPALAGVDVGNTGSGTVAPMTVTSTMLMYASTFGDGTPALYAVDKETGEEIGRVEVPGVSRYGMMNFQHEGKQYVVLQTGSTLTALALPD